MSDKGIWTYARENNLTIISKDSDFVDLLRIHGSPPKVIQIAIGNILNRDLYQYLLNNWNKIAQLSADHDLVVANRENILAL